MSSAAVMKLQYWTSLSSCRCLILIDVIRRARWLRSFIIEIIPSAKRSSPSSLLSLILEMKRLWFRYRNDGTALEWVLSTKSRFFHTKNRYSYYISVLSTYGYSWLFIPWNSFIILIGNWNSRYHPTHCVQAEI